MGALLASDLAFAATAATLAAATLAAAATAATLPVAATALVTWFSPNHSERHMSARWRLRSELGLPQQCLWKS